MTCHLKCEIILTKTEPRICLDKGQKMNKKKCNHISFVAIHSFDNVYD